MHLRVLSYNIHKCIGGIDRRYQPERIIDVLSHHDPDIVLLQEVDEGAPRSKQHRQVDLLGDELGYRHRTFFPNVQVRGGGVYGNAILSRFPILETQNVDLTVARRKPRSVLHSWVRVRIPPRRRERTLHVFNLHLGLSGRERRIQLQRFLASHPFARLHERTPIVVGGDFNDVWGTLGRMLELEGFRSHGRPLRTFPAYAPMRALDSIYIRGDLHLHRVHSSHLDLAKRASDHLPLVAELEIGARRG